MTTADHLFEDGGLAALYDLFCPWSERPDLHFYLPRVMAADAVLDVGCGTGALLRQARNAGHRGRLCGLDPARGMLAQARTRPDIEWVLGDLSSVAFDGEFDLVVMSGNAFQVFVNDEMLRTALRAIRRALKPDGRFAFETRNPAAREWERWTGDHAAQVVTPTGEVVRMSRRVETVEGDRVSFGHTFSSPGWAQAQRSRSILRFFSPEVLATALAQAGLEVEDQFGDWAGEPLTSASLEIVTIARPAP